MPAACSAPARLPRRRRFPLVSCPPPRLSLLLLLLLAAAGPARGWESGDLELFDLVEEVQLNFYEFLGVQQVSGPPAHRAPRLPRRLPGRNVPIAAERRGWGALGPASSQGGGQDLVTLGTGCPPLRGPPGSPRASLRRNGPPPPFLTALSPSQAPVPVTGWTVPPPVVAVIPSLTSAILGQILPPSCAGGRRKRVWVDLVHPPFPFLPPERRKELPAP